MPRPLAEYDLTDWAHLRPLQHAAKTARYRLIRSAYLRRPVQDGDLAAVCRAARGKRLLVTIAFDDPEILERHLGAVRRHIDDVVHLVADNSLSSEVAAAIRAICHRDGVAYLKLPTNPWSRRAASRSHGLALDWVFRNVVQPGAPSMFGFLDHDLMPTAACDPFAPLARQPVHGDKRWAGRRWFLWAGYCFFRPEALTGRLVDFGQDWFVGLDTGGGNWTSLYAALDPASLEERPIERIQVLADVPVADCYVEWRGTWLHEVGWGARPDLKAVKRRFFLSLLDRVESRPTADL